MIYKYVFIVIACLLASIIISYFFYYYKAKTDGRVTLMFFLLRIISVFAVLLVFVNIEISYTDYIEIKPKLVFLFDDSKSMADKSILIKEEYNKLRNSDFITDNYEVKYYKFGKNATLLDSLSFKEKQTDIYNSLNNIDIINRDSKAELFIVTDGISTSGYEYSDILYSNTINIVHSEFGITMEDVFIKKVNYNKKASVDTKFEIEVMTEYYGDRSVELELILKKGTKTLFRRAIKLDAKQNRALDVFELKENTKGFKEYRISISNLKDEKNTINNSKKINIEIGDYSQKVLLVYDKLHPDIGVLKRSVAKTYKINTVKIDDLDYKVLQNTDLTIVYQPNKKFEKLINKLNSTSINSLFVTGTKTDWGLLNSVNLSFNKKNRGGVLDAYPVVNHSYSAFSTRIDMQEYPPLKYTKGLVKYNDNFETLISIKGGQDYILATAKVQNKKVGLWQGEGLWLWRMYSYSEETKFEQFDSFMTDIIKYMSVKNYASRMQLDYKTEVYNNEPFEINVSKYNVNNKIDLRDDLFFNIIKEDQTQEKHLFAKDNKRYNLSLNSLEIGKYSFEVFSGVNKKVKKTGRFEILATDIEDVFNINKTKELKELSTVNQGVYMGLEGFSIAIEKHLKTQKHSIIKNKVIHSKSLIDRKYLVMFILLTLSVEWFLRKYHGKI